MISNENFEIWVIGQSRSFKPVLFESLGAVSYSPSTVTIAMSCASFARYSEILVENRDIFRLYLAFHAPVRKGVPVGVLPYRLVWKNQNGGTTP